MKQLVLFSMLGFMVAPWTQAQLLDYDWADQFSPTTAVLSRGMCVTSTPNVVASSGVFFGTVDFNQGAGVSNLVAPAGNRDMYLQYSTAANTFLWVQHIGGAGSGTETPRRMVCDGDFIYVVGHFNGSTDFNVGTVGGGAVSAGGEDIFLAQYEQATGNLVWFVTIGDVGNDQGFGIDLDPTTGDVLITGFFSDDADFGSGPLNVPGGDVDAFIASYTSAGVFNYVVQIGTSSSFPLVSTGNESIANVRVDAAGDVFVTGYYITTDCDFDPGAGTFFPATASGDREGFVAQYDNTGAFQWVTTFNGTGLDVGSDLAIDGTDVFVVGNFRSNTLAFSGSATTVNNAAAGSYDFLVASFDDGTGALNWVQSIGSTQEDIATCIELDGPTNIYVGGTFRGTVDFDVTAGTTSLTSAGGPDIFLARFRNTSGLLRDAVRIGAAGVDAVNDIRAEIPIRRLYATGSFQNTVDFDPDAVGVANLTAPFAATDNAYLAKYNYSLVPMMPLMTSYEGIEHDIQGNPLGTDALTGQDLRIEIYPNPTTGTVFIDHVDEGSVIELYSMDGSLVGTWTSLSEGRMVIDLAAITNGVYLASVRNADGSVSTARVIKQ